MFFPLVLTEKNTTRARAPFPRPLEPVREVLHATFNASTILNTERKRSKEVAAVERESGTSWTMDPCPRNGITVSM